MLIVKKTKHKKQGKVSEIRSTSEVLRRAIQTPRSKKNLKADFELYSNNTRARWPESSGWLIAVKHA